MKPFRFVPAICVAAVCALALTGCGKKQTTILVFHADSLNLPFGALAEAYQRDNPDVVVRRETGGSLMMARNVAELGRYCDILAVSDYRILDNLVIPEHADWQLLFSSNEMVVAYTGMSRGGGDIGPDNWYEVLLRPDVQYAHSDPNLDPSGLRAHLCWKLSSFHYKDAFEGDLYEALRDGCDPRNIRPDANQILPLLESVGGVDYLFTYRSVAEQHHLQYIRLPEEVNLGNPAMAEQYGLAEIEVTDIKGKVTRWQGAPIAYGLTVPNCSRAPEAAIRFIEFIISDEGKEILRQMHHPLIDPPLRKGTNIPATLLAITVLEEGQPR